MVKKNLKKTVIGTLAAVVLIALAISGSANAAPSNGGQPSAKATCKVTDLVVIGETAYLVDPSITMDWTPILSNTIKTANNKDLFVDVSLECGLYTKTKVDSLGGTGDIAEAMTAIAVRVVLDNDPNKLALPGEVNFARRSQISTAEFQGLLTDEDGYMCLSIADPNVDPNDPNLPIIIDVNCLRPETLELILDTLNANSFNFIFEDVESGVHTITVEAKIDTYTESTLDSGASVSSSISDDPNDTTLTVNRTYKFVEGDIILIDNEKLLVEGISGGRWYGDLEVVRGYDGTTVAAHRRRTRIYFIAGAEATAAIGNGSMTVEVVRMIKDEDILEMD